MFIQSSKQDVGGHDYQAQDGEASNAKRLKLENSANGRVFPKPEPESNTPLGLRDASGKEDKYYFANFGSAKGEEFRFSVPGSVDVHTTGTAAPVQSESRSEKTDDTSNPGSLPAVNNNHMAPAPQAFISPVVLNEKTPVSAVTPLSGVASDAKSLSMSPAAGKGKNGDDQSVPMA